MLSCQLFCQLPHTLPGEWLCYECRIGGRGEAAGLRIPVMGFNKDGEPAWAAYGLLLSQHLGPRGRSRTPGLISDASDLGISLYVGEEAAAK